MTFTQFVDEYLKLRIVHPMLRRGQLWYITLALVNDALIDSVPEKSDPFYRDGRVPEFLLWCMENWE